MSERLDQLLERLLGHARPRTDALDEKLVLPLQPEPWLVQRGETLLTLALAVELLGALERRGATGLRHSRIEDVRLRLRQRFDRNRWHHLEEELVHIVTWLEHALTTGGEALAPETDPAHLSFDPEPRRLLALEALDRHQDLYLELIDLAAMRYRRLRVRPERLETRPAAIPLASIGARSRSADDAGEGPTAEHDAQPVPCLVGASVPDGEPLALPLARIRWIMAVQRFSELPEPQRGGDVVRFPTRLRERDDDER